MNSNTRLQMILNHTPIDTVLRAIAQLNLPNWWLAGGAVRNTVWSSIFGNECKLGIKDFDIAFFDIEGNRSQELAAKATLTEKRAEAPGFRHGEVSRCDFSRFEVFLSLVI